MDAKFEEEERKTIRRAKAAKAVVAAAVAVALLGTKIVTATTYPRTEVLSRPTK